MLIYFICFFEGAREFLCKIQEGVDAMLNTFRCSVHKWYDKIPTFVVIVIVIAINALLFLKGLYAFSFVVMLVFIVFIHLVKGKRLTFGETFGEIIITACTISVLLPNSIQIGGERIPSFMNNSIVKFNSILGKNVFSSLNDTQADTVFIILLLLIYFIVYNLLMPNKKAMGAIPNSNSNAIFSEGKYKSFEAELCNLTGRSLNGLDSDDKWSDNQFIPLSAEVEIEKKGTSNRKIVNLLSALSDCHREKGKIFLVIGEPGSGKSVALRKLCRDLMPEAKQTGRIPIYINLKELNLDWTEDTMPSEKEFIGFIEKQLSKLDSRIIDNGLEPYFDHMLLDGRFFFIFDSYDEIPSLIGTADSSLINEELSQLIYNFLSRHNCGGILATRPFRCPTNSFGSTITLTIKSLDEMKIIKFASSYIGKDARKTIRNIYTDQPHLASLLSNPFYATLIFTYYENNNVFPGTQMEMFVDFILNRLKACSRRLEKYNLDIDSVKNGATLIAKYMSENIKFGLEVPIDNICTEYNKIQGIEKIIDVLCYAKICRKGYGEKFITFIHRRFQEFFLVSNFNNGGITIDESIYMDIPKNTRYRDALVLYCEIAEKAKAIEIAEFCWDIVLENKNNYRNIHDIDCYKATNCIQFIFDAFQNRTVCLASFVDDLKELISSNLDAETDLYCLPVMCQTFSLFPRKDVEKLVYKTSKLNNKRLNFEAIKSLLRFTDSTKQIRCVMMKYINSLSFKEFVKKYKQLNFYFSVSNTFKPVKRYCNLSLIDLFFPVIVTVLCLVFVHQNYGINNFFEEAIKIYSDFKIMAFPLVGGFVGVILLFEINFNKLGIISFISRVFSLQITLSLLLIRFNKLEIIDVTSRAFNFRAISWIFERGTIYILILAIFSLFKLRTLYFFVKYPTECDGEDIGLSDGVIDVIIGLKSAKVKEVIAVIVSCIIVVALFCLFYLIIKNNKFIFTAIKIILGIIILRYIISYFIIMIYTHVDTKYLKVLNMYLIIVAHTSIFK